MEPGKLALPEHANRVLGKLLQLIKLSRNRLDIKVTFPAGYEELFPLSIQMERPWPAIPGNTHNRYTVNIFPLKKDSKWDEFQVQFTTEWLDSVTRDAYADFSSVVEYGKATGEQYDKWRKWGLAAQDILNFLEWGKTLGDPHVDPSKVVPLPDSESN